MTTTTQKPSATAAAIVSAYRRALGAEAPRSDGASAPSTAASTPMGRTAAAIVAAYRKASG